MFGLRKRVEKLEKRLQAKINCDNGVHEWVIWGFGSGGDAWGKCKYCEVRPPIQRKE